ncbi:integrase core domain-containing protein, partial [Stutzerimonas xanthomarina]|uniref:integrase core domain-containing protein n=1 Tax=Stutzerimonas xanthomarina TaxID=271420 RepID=UPI003AA9A020
NGMAESFVKTMKRDYIAHMPRPDRQTALRNLAIAFEHYNEEHPHCALKYRSPREFRRLAVINRVVVSGLKEASPRVHDA